MIRIADFTARMFIRRRLKDAQQNRQHADTIPVRSGAMQYCHGDGSTDLPLECRGCLRFDAAALDVLTPDICARIGERIICKSRIPK